MHYNTRTRPEKRPRTAFSTSRGSTHQSSGSSPSRPRKKVPHESRVAVDDAEEDTSSVSETSSSGQGPMSSVAKSARITTGKSFVHRNAFDAYFSAASKQSHTSSNIFSTLVPPLKREECISLLTSPKATSRQTLELQQILQRYKHLFPRYALELAEGFSLLFFGFGSKRKVLNSFARIICAKKGHVVVINGYMLRVGIMEVIASIEEIPGLTNVPLPKSATALEAQTRRIYNFFLPQELQPQDPTSKCPLFLVIHNIDSPTLRTLKAKSILSLLASNPRIHLIASIDHINAQLIWSTTEASTRKHSYDQESVNSSSFSIPPSRGFAWVWHDMTTMQPYDAELIHSDLNSLKGKRGKAAGADWNMSESAARHILASVNFKAKKLFVLLANTLLTSFEEDDDKIKNKDKQPSMQLQPHALSYGTLFNSARRDFIATNDMSFRALLAEFRDHGLVLTLASGEGELLWIPLPAEELRRVVASLMKEQ